MNALLVAALLSGTASAWTADEPWRIVETEHFRIHYPLDTEAWALDLAARIDPMRERVADVVGWAPDHPTDIVVLDPWSKANGFALPFARAPRIGVFPTAAPASSGIGNYRLWAEDLLVHEDAHILHLARPARNPLERFVFDGLLGVPPIAVKSPAWVVEGYATLVEGVLTGAGRPNSDGRATFLRMLAAEGQLPTYDELDGSARWRGRSMRYLVGSAYLEWLTHEFGDERLPELWARMTAKERRSFEAAFEGTFGAPARELYGRFVAELSAGALAVEPPAGPAELFVDLKGEVEPPAVSPDGTRVATVEKKDQAYRLVVRSVAVDAEAVKEREEALAELLADDPDDAPPMAPAVAPHKEEDALQSPLFRPRSPRWIDSDRLLFTAWVADSHGVLQPDLFSWTVGDARPRRITRQQNLREAEPCGDMAVAVRREHGLSSLVHVDLASGAVTPLTLGRPTVVEASPRLDDTCTTVSWMRHDRTWTLMVAPLDALSGRDPSVAWQVPLPAGGQLLSADLHPAGDAVTAAIGSGGTIDLWTRDVGPGGTWQRRTARMGGAFDPEVTAEGDTFFLSTSPEGFDLYRLAAEAPAPAPFTPEPGPYHRGVVRPPPVKGAPDLPTGSAPEPTPYGLGPQQVRLVANAQGTRTSSTVNVGLAVGDLVGRSELLVLAGTWTPRTPGEEGDGPDASDLGARVVWTHRRFAVHTTLDAWWLAFDDSALGAGATGHLHRRWATGRVDTRLGLFGESAAPGFGSAATGQLQAAQWTALGPMLGWVHADAQGKLGLTGGEPTLGHAGLGTAVGQRPWSVGVSGRWAGGQQAPLQVGDVAPELQPEVRTLGTLWWPELHGLLPTTLTGARSARAEVRALDQVVGLFGSRAWLDCAPGTCDAPDRPTVVGLDARFGTDAQPIGTVPGLTFDSGVACMATAPDSTVDFTQCASWDHYTLWLSVRMNPGTPPAYPVGPWK